MTRVAVLCADLLFGSKLEGALGVAGHEVARFDDVEAAAASGRVFDVAVIDLTDPDHDGVGAVAAMRERHELDGVATLGFYSHIEVETRRLAEQAGFDRVVPRSRIAREAAALVEGLA